MKAKSEWVACPICGEEGMEKTVEDGAALIQCVNHACASNGGTNYDALKIEKADEPTKIQLNPDGTWLTID